MADKFSIFGEFCGLDIKLLVNFFITADMGLIELEYIEEKYIRMKNYRESFGQYS